MMFSKYNLQELNTREKVLLLDSFVNNGLDRYAFMNMINVIMNLTGSWKEACIRMTNCHPCRGTDHIFPGWSWMGTTLTIR